MNNDREIFSSARPVVQTSKAGLTWADRQSDIHAGWLARPILSQKITPSK